MNPQEQDNQRGCLMAVGLPFMALIMGIVRILRWITGKGGDE